MRFPDKPAGKTAYVALFICLALILSYVERLIPLDIGIPGIKPGLANIVIVFVIYTMGNTAALYVIAGRQLLTALLFGNPVSLLFSISGAVLSYTSMVLAKRLKRFSIAGVSALGGVAHNTAQIAAACVIMQNIRAIYYLPFLLIAGVVFGTVNGVIISRILKYLKVK